MSVYKDPLKPENVRLDAAKAAICESAETEIARLPCSRSTERINATGSTIHPMRQPVMQKYFEN